MNIQVAISIADVDLYTQVLLELHLNFDRAESKDDDEFVMYTIHYNFPHELHTLGYFYGKYKANLHKGC